MGYYTDYKLKLKPDDPETRSKILADLCALCTYKHSPSALQYLVDGGTQNWKWYDHHQELLAISKLNPDVFIILTGSGEDYPDFWVEYYKNGDSERFTAGVLYPPNPFDADDKEWKLEKVR